MKRPDKVSTKSDLLNTAIELFRGNGYDKVSIMQICRACEVSKTAFYFHYRSKEDLILDFYNTTQIKLEKNLSLILQGKRAIDRLWALHELYLRHVESLGTAILREVYKIYLSRKDFPNPIFNQRLNETKTTLLNQAKKDREIPAHADTVQLSEAMSFTLNGALFLWLLCDGSFDLVKRAKQGYYCILGA
ncbi:MAG: TetR/AcrR family transcriptional regulator [Spirochaetaceae bacterium]|jgi:AcrR family transcriptional regulator|nr:TetR/AcrR family transcriptional regulator [Spirochaetaceae bacterium]